MEKTEPSFVPQWLKGSPGGGAQQVGGSYQDDSGSLPVPKSRLAQQSNAIRSSLLGYNSPPGSTYSDRTLSSRRKHTSKINASTDRNGENISYGRSNRNVTCGRGYDTLGWSREGYKGNGVRKDKDIQGRERDRFELGERDKERETFETGMLRLQVTETLGKLESNSKLNRSQSLRLSSGMPDGNAWKSGESCCGSPNVASLSSSLASNVQKSAFEKIFPSLGTDEKLAGLSQSPTHSLWQGLSRLDLGRAGSPALLGTFSGSIATGQPISGGVDQWSSIQADVPSSNGGSALDDIVPTSSSSSTSAPVTPVAPLNMAEALAQNSPRVRTPPQSVDAQRLEELALKQYRQLIPVIPSLPKAMSLAEKTKSKSLRLVDNGAKNCPKSIQSSSLHANSLQRPLTASSKPDTPKQQGKLLFLKSSKDMATLKLEVSNAASQGSVLGNSSANSPSSSGAGVSKVDPQKPTLDRRASFAGPDTTRVRDPVEDKRAQDRIEFFNALRRKSASNDSSEVKMVIESVGCSSEVQEKRSAVSYHDDGIATCNFVEDAEGKPLHQSMVDNWSYFPLPMDSEEEEVAFMRSIGWEENAENSELTEEEITAFYKMRERKNFNSRQKFTMSSIGSLSSILSSSESESD